MVPDMSRELNDYLKEGKAREERRQKDIAERMEREQQLQEMIVNTVQRLEAHGHAARFAQRDKVLILLSVSDYLFCVDWISSFFESQGFPTCEEPADKYWKGFKYAGITCIASEAIDIGTCKVTYDITI